MRAARVIALVLALLCLATPALAANQISLSWDGKTWVDQLSGTLFNRPGAIARWVPGDSDTEHFYVRNQGGDAAGVKIEYDLPPHALLDAAGVVLTASVDGGASVVLTPGVGWLPLGTAGLADGAVADVAVTATFRGSSTNQSMSQQLPIDFRVTLTEALVGTPVPQGTATPHATGGSHGPGAGAGHGPGNGSGNLPGGAGHGGPGQDSTGGALGGLLPNTGAPQVGWFLGLGTLSLVGGIVIVALARRRRERDVDAS